MYQNTSKTSSAQRRLRAAYAARIRSEHGFADEKDRPSLDCFMFVFFTFARLFLQGGRVESGASVLSK